MTVYLLLGTAMCALLWLWRRNRRRQLGDFPRPQGWPIVGNLPQIDNKRFHLILEDWGKQYGVIYKINLMGDEVGK